MHHLETLIQAIPQTVFAAAGAHGIAGVSPSSDSNTGALTPFGPHAYPSGVPPPSLHVFPLLNPSNHFPEAKPGDRHPSPNSTFRSLLGPTTNSSPGTIAPDHLSAESASRMSLSAYLYFDDEGYTRWQGETSGLPLLDVLVERHNPASNREPSPQTDSSWPNPNKNGATADWFPNRMPRRADVNPETLWRLITTYIVPEVMDRYFFSSIIVFLFSGLTEKNSLVQCYLSTSSYILPFLHVPTFLAVSQYFLILFSSTD
jgi:hypothetical protein